jgi:hypothetical protein
MSDHPAPAVVHVHTKSVGLAIVLTFFFGPIGMLYSTIAGAAVMFVINIAALLLTAGIGLIVTWPIGIVWSTLAAMSHNKRTLAGTALTQVGAASPMTTTQPELPSFEESPTHRKAPATSTAAATQFDQRSALAGAGAAVVLLVVGLFVYQRIAAWRSSGASTSPSALRTTMAAISPGPSALSPETETSSRSSDGTFRGAWFRVWAPPGFQAVPSLKSGSAESGYDSVFFRSPDRQVEFYVFSPQWSGEPTDIALAPNERLATTETKTSAANVVTWYSIEATDGSYVRTYQDTRSSDGSVRWVVGLKYTSKAAFDAYRADYARFKSSLTQFAD